MNLTKLLLITLCLTSIATSCTGQESEDEILFSRTKMLRLVNEARRSGRYCGEEKFDPAPALKWNTKLEMAAKEHTIDMYEHNQLTHTGSDGKQVDARVDRQGYAWTYCGENVAYGALYEDEVMKEWLASPSHCVNIMNPKFREMGAWQSGLYWTQVFAGPKKQQPAP
jgi:uncharacterized protein YkwD